LTHEDRPARFPATAGFTAAVHTFEVTFATFVVSQTVEASGTLATLNGAVTSTCFGGTVTLQMPQALQLTVSSLCPIAGRVRVTGTATAEVRYLPGGVVEIHTNDDGVPAEVYSSCLAAGLLRCVETGAPTPTASRTQTPGGLPTATPTTSATTPAGVPTATPSPTQTNPRPPTVTRTPTRSATGTRTATPTPRPTQTGTLEEEPGTFFCSQLPAGGVSIPDGTGSGVSVTMSIGAYGSIEKLRAHLEIQYPYVGDLYVVLEHEYCGTRAWLLYGRG